MDLTIREATPEDAEVVAAIYAPFVTDTAVSFEEVAPSADEMAQRLMESHLWLVAERNGEVVGYAYAAPFHPRASYRWSVEVSIYLAEEARGHGVGRQLLGRLLEELRAAGFVNAFAGTTLPNDGSVALFESFGFERIALQRGVGYKLGAWHDVGWWQLQLRHGPVPPPMLGGR